MKQCKLFKTKTLAALDEKTNVLKALDHQQQSRFLDDRAVTLKYDRGKIFTVDNDMIDILLLMGKQTSKQFEIISVDPNSNKFEINDVDVSIVPDGIKLKGKVYDFSKCFLMFITSNDATNGDIKGHENKIKEFLKDIGHKQRGDIKK